MHLKQLIQLTKNNVIPMSVRLNAFYGLNSLDTPESSLAICQFALNSERKFSKIAKEFILKFSYSRITDLLSFILSSGGYSRKSVFNLLYELKERDVLRYIMENADLLSSDESKRNTLALWLKQLHITEKCIRGMLRLPTDLAKTLGKTLKKVDKDIHKEIVKFARGRGEFRKKIRGKAVVQDSTQAERLSLSADMSIRALDVLLEIVHEDEIAPFLVSLLSIKEPKIRSKAINLVTRISNRLPYIKKALLDDDERVRANAVAVLSPTIQYGEDDSLEAQSLLIIYLHDRNNRIRANTAKVFYEMGNILGFQTLMAMVADSDMMMRASAAWVLGELKAIWAAKELHNLAKDEHEIVRENAGIALGKIGEELLELTERFTSMGELVQQIDIPYGFDEFRPIAEFLLTLDPETQIEVVENISVANPSVSSEMLDNLARNPGANTSIAFILDSLYSVDNHLRSKAALVVGERCDREYFFERSMKDSDVRVVANVIEALWGRQTDFAKSFLKRGLDYPDNRVVVNAAIGLYKIEDPIGLATLIGFLNNPEPDTRARAAWALGEICDGGPMWSSTGVIDKLKRLQKDTEESVRLNATAALEKMTEAAAALTKKPGALNIKISYVDTSALPRLLLYVSVKNDMGQPIDNLTAENFVIAENDIIADRLSLSASEENPLLVSTTDGSMRTSVAIVMDYSRSMIKADIKTMESAVQDFVSQMSPHDRGCVIKFSGDVDIVQPLTSDRGLLLNSIKKRYNSKSDGTVLYDSIYAAVEQLRREENGIKSIVVLTDGGDSSRNRSMESLVQCALDQSVSIYTIGLGSEVKNTLLQIAASTGGNYYPVVDTNWLGTIYQSISKTLKSHYVISYTITRKPDLSQASKVSSLKINVKYDNFTSVDTISLLNRGI